MEINEVVIDKKQVVGIKISTSNTNESNPEAALIPALWQQYFSENIGEQIKNKLSESKLLGVYTDYDDNHQGCYAVIAGNEVSTTQNISKDLVGLEIPAVRYLVFSEEGDMPSGIFSLWKKIWDYFSHEAKYRRAFTTDFELYNNDSPSRIEIYVAVKEV